jgi:HlyD family secretion protein
MATEVTTPVVLPKWDEETQEPRRSFQLPYRLIAAGVVGLVVLFAAFYLLRGGSSKGADGREMTKAVTRGNMVIVVTEDGNVESSSNVDVKCEVAGGSTILWLVKDGTRVNEGDDLVRLDSSTIEDQVNSQKIAYAKAEAAKIEAEKTFSASKIAVQEFIEGNYVQQIQDAEGKITVAMENLRSAQNSMQHTDRMARKGYVTSLQREAQAFAVEQAKINLTSAHTAKNVLEKFTKPKMLVDLESKRDTAEAKMRSEEAAFALETARLKRLQTQLEKCTVIAPHSGMVVYANETAGRGGQQTIAIEEGAGVRERQSIIRLPDLTHMQVKVTVHESKVDQLRPGMRARIQIQDRDFQGEVASVANQPEPGNWLSGNVKKYATIVRIDGQELNLRPGMTAVVEILVADLKNVLSVPVEAVVEQGNHMYCWVHTSGTPERRPVVIGQSSSTQVEIRDGLAEGDVVLLNPRAVVPEAREEIKPEESAENVKNKFGASKGVPSASADAGSGGGSRGADGAASGNGGAGNGGSGRRGGAGGRPQMKSFSELDANSDGKLTVDELPERMQPRFDSIDTNTDGAVDAKEFATFRAEMKKRMEANGGGGGGPPGQ